MSYDRDKYGELFIRFFDAVASFNPKADWIIREFDRLVEHYTEDHRHYHNLVHIRAALEALDRYYLDPTPEMRLAVWYHDVIYDPASKSNEIDSVHYARASLSPILPNASWKRIESAIKLTKGHDLTKADPEDLPMLVADLAEMGSTNIIYLANKVRIRHEFIEFTDDEWKAGRTAFLTDFLGRERIFPKGVRFDDLEKNARTHMKQELEDLR